MTLKRKINNLEDVDEALRSLYTKQHDGTYRLDAEDDDDVSGLKAALEMERENVGKSKKELHKLRQQYQGVDLEEYEKILADAEALRKKKLLDSGQVDELVNQRLAKAQKDWDSQRENLSQENQTLRRTLSKELIENRLSELATKHAVRPEALRDVKLRGQSQFRVNEAGEIEAFDGERVRYGKDPTKPLSMEEWFDNEKKESPHWFDGSAGAGVPPGASHSVRPGGGIVLTKEAARDPAQYRIAKEQSEKTGQPIQIE